MRPRCVTMVLPSPNSSCTPHSLLAIKRQLELSRDGSKSRVVGWVKSLHGRPPPLRMLQNQRPHYGLIFARCKHLDRNTARRCESTVPLSEEAALRVRAREGLGIWYDK